MNDPKIRLIRIHNTNYAQTCVYSKDHYRLTDIFSFKNQAIYKNLHLVKRSLVINITAIFRNINHITNDTNSGQKHY